MILTTPTLRAEFIQNAFEGCRFDNTGLIRQVWYTAPGGQETPFLTEESLVPGFGTGGMGLACEFGIENPPGYDDAEPGELFLKIGVGWLRRPDEYHYRFPRAYEIVDRGSLSTEIRTVSENATEIQTRWDSGVHRGYGCVYTKTYRIEGNTVTTDCALSNTGDRALWNYEYAHNFFSIGETPVEEGAYHLTTDDPAFDTRSRCEFIDYDHFPSYFSTYVGRTCEKVRRWTLKRNADGLSVSETVDFTPVRVAVWSMPHVISCEVFHEFTLAPEERHTWQRVYTFGEQG